MVAGNFDMVKKDAVDQVAAGAMVLDINAGVTAVNPNETEPPLLRQTLEIVQSLVDVPLCIDSSVPAALKAGLEIVKGRPLVNSVTGEEDRLEAILPLVARHGAAVIGLANAEDIPMEPERRLEVARKIVSAAGDHGIPPEDVVIDRWP